VGNRVRVTVSVIMLLLAVAVAASFVLAWNWPVELGDAHQTDWRSNPAVDQDGNVYIILRTQRSPSPWATSSYDAIAL
jgi:hypothetical protein